MYFEETFSVLLAGKVAFFQPFLAANRELNI